MCLHWLQAGDNLGWDMGNLNCDNIIDAADLNVVGLDWLAGVEAVVAPIRSPRAPLAIAVAMLETSPGAMEVQIEAAPTTTSADSCDSNGGRALDVLVPDPARKWPLRSRHSSETGRPSLQVAAIDSLPEHMLDEVHAMNAQQRAGPSPRPPDRLARH